MWSKPSAKELSKIPNLYEPEEMLIADKIIYLHFFIGGSDWYVAEFDGDDLFFGFAILNGDRENAEWGYFSLKELDEIKINGIEIDCDLHWETRKASEVKEIKRCNPDR